MATLIRHQHFATLQRVTIDRNRRSPSSEYARDLPQERTPSRRTKHKMLPLPAAWGFNHAPSILREASSV
jgi:hypothetical protein